MQRVIKTKVRFLHVCVCTIISGKKRCFPENTIPPGWKVVEKYGVLPGKTVSETCNHINSVLDTAKVG